MARLMVAVLLEEKLKNKAPFVRSPYNYDTDTRDSAFCCVGESKTSQQFKDECDINTIVRRFNLTGQMPSDVRAPQYGDFEDVVDYQTALNAVIAAQGSFNALPADVRSRFSNDPGLFVDFCSDPENLPELRKLGLAVPEAAVPSPPSSPDPAP